LRYENEKESNNPRMPLQRQKRSENTAAKFTICDDASSPALSRRASASTSPTRGEVVIVACSILFVDSPFSLVGEGARRADEGSERSECCWFCAKIKMDPSLHWDDV
jgi:hypothetical protein